MKLRGLFTAMVTPFRTEDGKLDEDGLRQNIKFQVESGVDGIVVIGTTGEKPTLSGSERESVVKIAVEEAAGRVHVMVGAGTNSTEGTIAEVQQAEALGADSAIVVTPYYNKPTQRGLFHHYEAIAEAAALPIVVYNVPSRTGVNIEPLTLREIAQIPGIVGLKESCGNAMQVAEILNLLEGRDDFSILSGDDWMTFPLMTLGGDGVVSVLSNVTPRRVGSLVQALQDERLRDARKIYYELLPLFRAIFLEPNPIPIKEAMRLAGMAAGPCRLPLTPMSETHRASLERLLVDAGLVATGVARR